MDSDQKRKVKSKRRDLTWKISRSLFNGRLYAQAQSGIEQRGKCELSGVRCNILMAIGQGASRMGGLEACQRKWHASLVMLLNYLVIRI